MTLEELVNNKLPSARQIIIHRHIQMENRLTAECQNRTAQGIDSGRIAEHIECKSGKEAERHRKIGTGRQRERDYKPQEYKRHSHVEENSVVEYYRLRRDKEQKRYGIFDKKLGHRQFPKGFFLESFSSPACSAFNSSA